MSSSDSLRALWACLLIASAPSYAQETKTVHYVYDSVYRLVEVRYPDRIVRYTYDPAGNRLLLAVEAPNPLPVLASISPAMSVVGASGFTLQVTGSGFVAGSVVQWNGSPRATTFVSPTQLSAVIDAADLMTTGTASVTVSSPSPGGGVSGALTFTINATAATPVITWANPAPITIGTALTVEHLNATADVPGTFDYEPPAGTVLAIGIHTLSVTFTPTDSVNYTTATKSVSLEVLPLGGARSVPFDFDDDDRSDVLWRHGRQGDVWLWPMDGANRQAETYVKTVAEAEWEIRGLGDQTGDGKADILWRHATSGMLYLWTMNGSAVEAETYVGTVETAYDIVGAGDYNGDGRSDILWRHLANGQLWLWLMDGPATLQVSYVDTVDPAYEVQASGDLNGDGRSDIVWRHTAAGDVWVWLMNGATPEQVAYVHTVAELEYRIVGVAVHTGDGKADLLWHHDTRGEVWLWPMNGTTLVSQTYVDTVPDTGYGIVGNGDYDGDGMADILWHHATRGEVWVWLMNGAAKLSETYVATVPDAGYQIVRIR